MGEEQAVMLDPMVTLSFTGVSSHFQANADGGGKVVSPNRNGTAYGTDPHEAGAPEWPKFESHSVASEEETDNLSKMKSGSLEEEERVSDFEEENLKQENNGLENSSTLAAVTDAPQQESLDKLSPELALENEAVVQTEETAKQEGEAPALIFEKQEEVQVPDVMDFVTQNEIPANSDELEHRKQEVVSSEGGELVKPEVAHPSHILIFEKQEETQVSDVMDFVKQDEIPAISDEQEHKKQDFVSSRGGELVKPEVAHRSHILGSLSKLDENSARQLLNDSGWNVSQSTRMNGKTQWYYRSPPPKPVLVGSLTSAVAMWKRLVDEDHKRKGGGDDDLYPMVTAFLNNVKRPAAKKRKRGRHTD